MNSVFQPEHQKNFIIFSMSHLFMIALMFLVILTFIVFRQSLRSNGKVRYMIRWGFFSVLILSEASYQIWSVVHAVWDPRFQLPLQLCSISSFVVLYFLLKPTPSRFQLVYFIALLPPLLAIITPDLLYNSPHYRFFQFFIHHISLVSVVFFYIIVEKFRPKFKSILIAFMFINLIALPISFVNQSIGSNYMFLEGPPSSNTLLSLFGTGYSYLIKLEIVTITAFFLTYVPFLLKNLHIKHERKNDFNL
ncbi:TIGR02206 family membrane protein [Pseudalkalibacillus berkeleyi]|uniref:TIGR02206 family membrane protein n=1 Tax=Pseudalkalibacillus berkeleyi TaxID=1069813 RepID=A0ABS9H5U8_9BACL|nr:TIGR02206 family membrane protein [Pseudalkalibacillus berkeleyi]MCF6139248.1 TIGR02206 family membrane protein [Pseudalkalibacillus berkeleyi]